MNRKIAILEGHLNRARMEMQANVDELVRIAKGNSWNAHTKSQTELEHRIRDAKIMITKLTGQIMIAKSNSRKQYFTSEGKAKLDAAERHYKYLLEQEKYRTPIVHRVPVPTVIVEAKPSGGHWEEVVTRKYFSDGDSPAPAPSGMTTSAETLTASTPLSSPNPPSPVMMSGSPHRPTCLNIKRPHILTTATSPPTRSPKQPKKP